MEGFLQSRRLSKDVFIGIPSKLAVIDMYAELSDPDSALFHITDL